MRKQTPPISLLSGIYLLKSLDVFPDFLMKPNNGSHGFIPISSEQFRSKGLLLLKLISYFFYSVFSCSSRVDVFLNRPWQTDLTKCWLPDSRWRLELQSVTPSGHGTCQQLLLLCFLNFELLAKFAHSRGCLEILIRIEI